MFTLNFIFNKKKDYFQRKRQGIQYRIWDLEFKRFKAKELREDMRQAYDDAKQKLQGIEATKSMAEEAKTLPKEELARLDDQIVLLKRDIERYESQMRSIDIQIYGSKQTNEYPEGYEGIEQNLDGLRELLAMVDDYLKRL
jgi:chromosome segregation ATPase